MASTDAVAKWRALIGPTKVFRSVHDAPVTIRGVYGLTDTRNAVHGSDSEDSTRTELQFFFPDFCMDDWFSSEERRLLETTLQSYTKYSEGS